VRITFISHGATAAVRKAAFPVDEALEATELSRIARLGWQAPRAQQILCGPERRAMETGSALGLTAAVDGDLRDCDYGNWRGLELSDLQERNPEGVVEWLSDPSAAPHGGESIAAVLERVGRWLEGRRDSGHTLAVTNPAVIRSAIVTALNAPPETFWRIDISPLSFTDLRYNGRSWSVRCMGCELGRRPDPC
jgi:broad specificity phosphatase PhoE